MNEDEQGLTVSCPVCACDMDVHSGMAACLHCQLVIKKPAYSQADMITMIRDFM